MSILSERLVIARNNAGLTQYQLAHDAEISRSAYSLYELGKREPSIELLVKLSKILKVDIAYLLGLDENQTEDSIQINNHYLIKFYDSLGYTIKKINDESYLLINKDILNPQKVELSLDELHALKKDTSSYLCYKISEFKKDSQR